MPRRLALPFLFAFAAAGAACAPTAPVREAQPPGVHPSFQVKVSGEGRPLILIPGLACTGEVWDSTVARFQDHYQLHVLTLGGFGGAPAFKGEMLSTVETDLAAYIRDTKLTQPVLIGHSLGAVIAYSLAADHPELVGGVVAVDGVPFYPALMDPGATPLSARPFGEKMAGFLSSQDAAGRHQSNVRYATTAATDPAQQARITAWGDASDPSTVGRAFVELCSTDLRAKVRHIQAPLLLIASESPGADSKTVSSLYEGQVASVPKHRVLVAQGSHHFVMFDRPEFLFDSIQAFLTDKSS